MKGLRYILPVVLAAFSFGSCTSVGLPDVGVEQPVVDYPIDLHLDGKTKISVDGLSVKWEMNDQLGVVALAKDTDSVYVNNGTAVVHQLSADNHSASFSGYVTMAVEPQTCLFTYPVSSGVFEVVPNDSYEVLKVNYGIQTGNHEPFMYSVVSYDKEGITTSMKYVGATLKIESKIDGVKKITFQGNRFEKLYPFPLNVSVSNETLGTVSEANTSFSVDIQDGTYTYINVPPVNFTEGFTLICETSDGRQMLKSFSNADFTQKRGQLIPITLDGAFEEFSIDWSDFVVEHQKISGLLSGTKVTFKMSKAGTTNKLIEEWGATLVDSNGKTVRAYTSTGDITSGNAVVLTVQDGYSLLLGGTYTFSPYYKMYGKRYTVDSKSVTVADPGVNITLEGKTSYDTYLASGATAANNHRYDLIKGMKATTNLHPNLINSYTATLGGEAVSHSSASNGVWTYNDMSRTSSKNYPFKVVIKVGAHTFTKTKDMHITGLPYTLNMHTSSLDYNWSYSGDIKIIDNRDYYIFKSGASYMISPKFHAPKDINVQAQLQAYNYHGTEPSSSAEVWIAMTSSQSKQVKSGQKHTFSGTGWYPAQATFASMQRNLVCGGTDNRVCISVDYSFEDGFWGTSTFGPGLVAKEFTLKYR